MKKKLKPTPLASRAEFQEVLGELATLDAQRRELAAKRTGAIAAKETLYKEAVAEIEKEYGDKIETLEEQMSGKLALAEAYAAANRRDLLASSDAKSVKVAHGTFGWSLGKPSVAPVNKQLKSEDVIALLKENGLGAYVRTTEEIARDRILADCKNKKTLVSDIGRDGQKLKRKRHIALVRAGLKISQKEEFFFDPAMPTSEAIKPSAVEAAA